MDKVGLTHSKKFPWGLNGPYMIMFLFMMFRLDMKDVYQSWFNDFQMFGRVNNLFVYE